MSLLPIAPSHPSASLSRRGLFAILPAGTAACLGCARAAACAPQAQPAPAAPPWTAGAGLTWEQVFRFAYQKDLIPLLSALAERIGRDEFVKLLQQASDDAVARKSAGRPPVVRDLVTFAANMKTPPPLIQHTLVAEIVEQSTEAFEYRVSQCLWAKTFRDSGAADIGYAMVCYPDFAVARSLNPKLKLIRTQTLMQGAPSCSLRYIMET